MRVVCIAATLLLSVGASFVAQAQESASYRLKEHVLNLGGHPADGVVMTSGAFKLSLDSLGESAARVGLSGASFRMDAAFVTAYPPPGEVLGLRFIDSTTLQWDPEPSVGVYDVYRDGLAALSGGQYGQCWQQDVVGSSVTDADPIAAGGGFFYLVTANNRLGEAGTKGSDSSGGVRAGSACP